MKNLTVSTLILALLTLTGCFDYDENIVINEDGSGTVELHFAFEEAYLKQMEEIRRQMAEQMGMPAEDTIDAASGMFDKAEIEAALNTAESGIAMSSYEESVTDGVRHYKLNFTFDDINKIHFLYTAVYPDDEEDEYGVTHDEQYGYEDNPGEEYPTEENPPDIYTPQDDGSWLFDRPMDSDLMESDEDEVFYGDQDGEEGQTWESESGEEYGDGGQLGEIDLDELKSAMEGLGAQMQGMAEQMGKEHHFRFTITFPGAIVESNATSVDGNTAVWEIRFDQEQQGFSSMTAVIKP